MGILQLKTQKIQNYSTKGRFTPEGCFRDVNPSLLASQGCPGGIQLQWDQGEGLPHKRRVTHARAQCVTFPEPEPTMNSCSTKTFCLKGHWKSELHCVLKSYHWQSCLFTVYIKVCATNTTETQDYAGVSRGTVGIISWENKHLQFLVFLCLAITHGSSKWTFQLPSSSLPCPYIPLIITAHLLINVEALSEIFQM